MIFRILLLIVILILAGCGNQEKESSKRNGTLYQAYLLTDIYYQKSFCPAFTTLAPGTYTISLKEGEEYWFDITTRIGNFNSDHSYLITVVKTPGQTINATRTPCFRNKTLSEPNQKPITFGTELLTPYSKSGNMIVYDLGFGPERIPGYNLGAIKSIAGAGEVSITIPSTARTQYPPTN